MIEYFEKTLQTLTNSLKTLKSETFDAITKDCKQILENGGKIIASGLGKNVPICEKFVGTMNSFTLDARFLHTNTAVHGDLGMITKDDLVIILSKSGNTEESVLLNSYLVERGCKVWLLSCNEKSKLSEVVENKIIIPLEDEGDLWNISPNNSTTLYLMFLQGLAVELCKQMDIKLVDYKKNHPGGGIGQLLKNVN